MSSIINDLHFFFFFCLTADERHNVTTFENDPLANSVDPEFIWATTTVAVGDTAVLHCSFDAIFSQLRNGNVSINVYLI